MAESLTVRRYEPADADRVWTVHEQALRASELPFIGDASVDADLRVVREHYLDQSGEFLVGLVAGELTAIGGFQPESDQTTEIRRMRVHPDWQGRGFGRQMLQELEDRARAQDSEHAVLGTHEQLTAARSLYESAGYTETHRETRPPAGDLFVYYRKKL